MKDKIHSKTIAFVHPVFPCGGAENVTLTVGRELSAQGYRIVVLCEQFRADIMPADSPIEIAYYTEHKTEKKEHTIEMVEKVRQLNIDVLMYVVTNPRYIDYLRQHSGARVVIANHGMMYWQGVEKAEHIRRKHNKNLWWRLRWKLYYQSRTETDEHYVRRAQMWYRRVMRRVDAYMVLCESYRQQLIADLKLTGEAQNKIWVVPNFQEPNPHPQLKKEQKVIFVGRLTHTDKRVDRLLRIWAMVEQKAPGWQLQIVGDGDQREALEKLAQRLGLQRVSFEGRQAPQPYYDRAAVLCLTSTHEGWGLVLTEAQTNGVVPIAFNSSAGIETILSPSGVHGILVKPFDLEEYARQLLRLMLDTDWRQQLQETVRQQKFSLEETCRCYKNMFDHLLETPHEG